MHTLRYDAGPPPTDPSNVVADDPRAQLLGRRLFFDASLSGPLLEGDHDGTGGTLGLKGESGKVSCASCHVPSDHFVDTRSPHGQISLGALWTKRRTPTLLEVAFAPLYNWDGRRDSIWGQALGVMESEREFNSGRLFIAQQVVRSYQADYAALFGESVDFSDESLFPQLSPDETGCTELTSQSGVTYECRGKPGDNGPYDQLPVEQQDAVTEVAVNAAKALEAYVRQLRCGASRFDGWLDGDDSALSPSELRGAALFVGKAECVGCHSGSNLTDGKFHNVGLRPAVVAVAFTDTDDHGASTGLAELMDDPLNTRGKFSSGAREQIPESIAPEMEGAFRTPTLRCIQAQPSFMHTGQFRSLASTVSFFSRGGDGPGAYPGTSELKRLDLTDSEQADLVAFLGTLAGPGPDKALLTAPSTPPSLEPNSTCGLENPAFCATFDESPGGRGRSGELDPNLWSGLRAMPSLHPYLAQAFPVGPAFISNCREDVNGTLVWGDQDALLCAPTEDILSPHLVIAAAAQNYGMTSYRIRQPFDFADRVGTLSMDVNLKGGILGGWPAIGLSADPTPAPTFNYPERGSGPKNGILIEFYSGLCNIANSVLPLVYTYRDYVETAPSTDVDCDTPHLIADPSALHHLTVRVGQGQLEIWGSEPALAGNAPDTPILLFSQAIELPFSRAYVNLIARNHATIKYWEGAAWLTRWDNVAFDGPLVSDSWEYSVPDPLTESHGNDGCTSEGQCIWRGEASERNLDAAVVCSEEQVCDFDVIHRDSGWAVPGVDEEPILLTLPAVSLQNAAKARLALAVDYPWFSWNDIFPPPTQFNLRYRLNGLEWHDRFVSEDELNAFAGDPDEGPGAGLLNQIIELELSELHEGDNTVELALDGAWTGSYRAAVTGVDLILTR